jgi:hypothetical protein
MGTVQLKLISMLPKYFWLLPKAAGFRFQAKARNASLRHHFHTSSGTHTASFSTGIEGTSSVGTAIGVWIWTDLSLVRRLVITLPHVFMVRCFIIHKANVTLQMWLQQTAVATCVYRHSNLQISTHPHPPKKGKCHLAAVRDKTGNVHTT